MTGFWRERQLSARLLFSICQLMVIGALVLMMVACGQPSPAPQPVEPTATTPAEPAATATAVPEPAPTEPPPAAETNFHSHLTNYSILIPKEWRVIDPRHDDIDTIFAKLGDSDIETVVNVLETFQAMGGIEQVDFVARSKSATWTVVVVPRSGLTLDDYLTTVANQLGDQIQRRGINTTLRPNGIPAATLDIVAAEPDDQMRTYQVTHYDESAQNLIIHSFSALPSDLDNLRNDLNDLVKSVAWN